jgi:hypothetical protein
MEKLIGPVAIPLAANRSEIGEIIGGKGPTVTVNDVLALNESSAAVSVTVAIPVRPFTGVMVAVRLAPLPPNTIPLIGINCESEELADNIKFPGALSLSPTRKFNAGVAIPCGRRGAESKVGVKL